MALENISGLANLNLSSLNPGNLLGPELISALPPEMITKLDGLISIFKFAGIIVIAYLVFLIIKSLLGIRKGIRFNKMYKKIMLIDKKLDLLLGKKKIKDFKEKLEETLEKEDENKADKKNKVKFREKLKKEKSKKSKK